jgi:hypothetical protein
MLTNESVQLPPILDFLTHVAKTLVRFRIKNFLFNSEPVDYSPSPIELSMLESLEILYTPILQFLRTPRLRSLSITDMGSRISDTFIGHCLSLELSTLESLQLDTLNLSCFKNQPAVLRGLPHLTELMLWGCSNESVFLSLLRRDDDDNQVRVYHNQGCRQAPSISSMDPEMPDVIMPRLHSLTISIHSSWPILQAIIEDRIAKGIHFRVVRFRQSIDTPRYSLMLRNWLNERNIAYESCDQGYKIYQRADPEVHEWMNEESYFLEPREPDPFFSSEEDDDSDDEELYQHIGDGS